jgi:hypothetical protein
VGHVEVIINCLELTSIVIVHIYVLGTFSEDVLGDDITCHSFESRARIPQVPGLCNVIESLQDSVRAVDDDMIQLSNIFIGGVWIGCCAALAMESVRLSGNQ